MRSFMEMLKARFRAGRSVCVGLDTEIKKIPKSVLVQGSDISDTITAFNCAIVEATKDFVCAYKPNIAFYEAYRHEGMTALKRTIAHIRFHAPEVPVILDCKRGDIGNTNAGYIASVFDGLLADAVTVSPYLGREAMQPFLDRKDKGIIVLCRTSNPGAGEFQDLEVKTNAVGDTVPLYQYVARRIATNWNDNGNVALVVGATYPGELAIVRDIVGDMPLLIPGIGAQGGDVERTVHAGRDSQGQGMIINSSRGIIYASSDADFAEAARRETEKLHDSISKLNNSQSVKQGATV